MFGFAFARCCCAQAVGEEEVFGASVLDVATGEYAPVLQPGERKTLHVPADFSIRSVNSAASNGPGYVSLDEVQKAQEMQKLQHMIRDFFMELLQGVFLDAVLEDGSVVPCRVTMDRKLSVMKLQVSATVKTIFLSNIQEICTGKESNDLRVTTPLDDHCVTLVMADDQCVSFKFATQQACEHFVTCMKVLRLALD